MIYWLTRGLCRLMLRVLYRWRITGDERIPTSGGVIVCANHFNWLDPVVVGCSLKRRIHFMSKYELFRGRISGAFMRQLGAFPVRRGTPDRGAMRTALAVLTRGDVLGMFPEGTRSPGRELQPAQLGAGLLAVWSGCLIVPIAIRSTYRPFSLVEVRIGEPIGPVYPSRGDREAPQRLMTAAMDAISKLLARPDR